MKTGPAYISSLSMLATSVASLSATTTFSFSFSSSSYASLLAFSSSTSLLARFRASQRPSELELLPLVASW
jgi:hypothetical protein